MRIQYTALLISLLYLLQCEVLFADTLIFGTPPTQSYKLTKTNYQPLVTYLGQKIGRDIIVKPANSFHEYTRRMKENYYDIIFDGPHFIKYRIDNLLHRVLVKQPGKLNFAVIVHKESAITRYSQLLNKRVCSPATPHLGTLTFLSLYPSPVREPFLIPVQSFKHAIACVRNNTAVAAVVRDKYWFNKVKDKDDLKVIYITQKDMPARGLSVNKLTVNNKLQQKIVAVLTNKKASKLIKKALSTIGGKKFIKPKYKEYENVSEVLSIVWGFHYQLALE